MLDAPTNRMMPISRRLVNAAIRMVLAICNDAASRRSTLIAIVATPLAYVFYGNPDLRLQRDHS